METQTVLFDRSARYVERLRTGKPVKASELTSKRKDNPADSPLRTIDLFCGAGGITEGFRQAGYHSLYGNDIMPEAIETFALNHPDAFADCRQIENVDPREVREQLGLQPGDLDVLVGGPPCQGFSINAPDRFLNDPRNKLFRHYERFVEEFQPKTFLLENVPLSVVRMPLFFPRMLMETFFNGVLFSSVTFPLITANLFCAKE